MKVWLVGVRLWGRGLIVKYLYFLSSVIAFCINSCAYFLPSILSHNHSGKRNFAVILKSIINGTVLRKLPVFQVEYAMEAIGHAGTCLGILANDGELFYKYVL